VEELGITAEVVVEDRLELEHLELVVLSTPIEDLETREDIVHLKDFQAVVGLLTLEALAELEDQVHLTLYLDLLLFTLQEAEAERTVELVVLEDQAA
jgi:hypothetical protein